MLYVERGGRGLLTLGEPDEAALRAALSAVAAWAADDARRAAGAGASGQRRLRVERADGEPVTGTRWADLLAEAGFRQDLRGMLL